MVRYLSSNGTGSSSGGTDYDYGTGSGSGSADTNYDYGTGTGSGSGSGSGSGGSGGPLFPRQTPYFHNQRHVYHTMSSMAKEVKRLPIEDIEQIKIRGPLAHQTETGQVYKAILGLNTYAVKLFEPYSAKCKRLDRHRLQSYNLSDAELEARFHPWRRERRVYEHIDKHISYPTRQFFPIYYGATMLSWKLCPREWRTFHNNREDVPIIILELLDGIEVHNAQGDVRISNSTRQYAQELYKNGLDAEYVHIYIHCMEKMEVLHGARVIHGDIKPDVFMNCASVICDFSRSWSWDEGKEEPCLDAFSPHRGPKSFEDRRKGEQDSLRTMVIREHDGPGTELRGRVPSLRHRPLQRKQLPHSTFFN
ncbi:hypothetical protein GMDG_05744 [Pseudogymnoascus destructans 20631-21]|uniref:Protein kinase domain-containing protein n=1 Tax=Pseudogymnoascus destructans (strain ATCC MYA-4855 / 20631-21) TaxID=658429 RepID=L8FPH5_PSED2|nr:hypothetical protein GMDG_05744 [Pseudogymnoascus destructans 20631-21]